MVEEADAGLDPRCGRSRRASSVSRSAVSVVVRSDGRLATRQRARLGAERAQQDVVLRRPPHGDPDRRPGRPGRRSPAPRAGRPSGSSDVARDEVRRRRRAVVARRRRAPSRIRSRSAIVASTSPRRGSRSAAAAIARGGPADRRRRAPLGEQRGGLRVRERVADPQRREPERLRHRPDDDEVRRARRPTGAHDLAAELDVRLVDDDDRVAGGSARARRAPRARRTSPVGLFGLQTQQRSRRLVRRRRSRRRGAGRDPVERVRRRRDRRAPSRARGTSAARSRMRSSAPAPTTTFSGREPGVRRRRLAQLAVRARPGTR